LGYYEFPSKPFTSLRTESIPIPGSLIAKCLEGEPQSNAEKLAGPRLVIMVRCDSRAQYLGAAKADLYLLDAEGNFYVNFFKGALGIWMRLCLVIGVAVTCSTYLNGVVSFLVTAVLIGLGFLRSFIVFMVITQLTVAYPNPGPADSMRKLINNEPLGVYADASNPTHQVTQAADDAFRWSMRRVISTIPNLERLTWQEYVANGYDVPFDDLFWNFLGVAGYLSLWAVLAHYLFKWREIATW
jgi:ABC-type transport system involved in multi-copper enzyme maturation permease subunit